MQEDKPALTDALDTWEASVEVTAAMVPVIAFKPDRMREALLDGFVTATELADHLVTRGVPFRDAHHVVGNIVGDCLAKKRRLDELSLEDLRGFHADFGDDALEWVDLENAVERRDIPGGPAKKQVLAALKAAKEELGA
jgi:argininosuccinate lyase